MAKYKIAICISGQLRKLPRTKINKIASALGADVYIHTWDHEHNPYLKDVQKYFPDAVMKVEKYEETFDNILANKTILKNDKDEIGRLRYDYAQMYTVLESLKLCKASDKQYDIILRCRTDLDLPLHVYTDEDLFDKLVHKVNETWIHHHIHSNFYNNPNRRNIKDEKFWLGVDHDEMHKPFVATTTNSETKYLTACQDWFFMLNRTGLDRMCEITSEEIIMLSHTYKMLYQFEKFGEVSREGYGAMKTPSVFYKIWLALGMTVLSHSDFLSGLIRYKQEDQKFIPQYGDLS